MTAYTGPNTNFGGLTLAEVNDAYVSDNGGENYVFNSAMDDVGGTIEVLGDWDAIVYTRQESEVDVVTTGSGDDQINTGGKADVINAGDGDDIVRGGPGGDNIRGGRGADILILGEGTDVVNYIADPDVGVFGEGGDLEVGVADQIVDFNQHENDILRIDLQGDLGASVEYDAHTGEVIVTDGTGTSSVIANLDSNLHVDIDNLGDGVWTLM